VAVDGKLLGKTPKSVRVSPGVHTVVIAGESERRVMSVNVEPGASKSVSASFEEEEED
jgi:hypothetical protein